MQGKPCNRPDQCSRSAQQNTDRVLRQRLYPPGRRCAGHYEGQSRSAPPVRRLPRGHPPQARFHCVQSQPKGCRCPDARRAAAAPAQAEAGLPHGGGGRSFGTLLALSSRVRATQAVPHSAEPHASAERLWPMQAWQRTAQRVHRPALLGAERRTAEVTRSKLRRPCALR